MKSINTTALVFVVLAFMWVVLAFTTDISNVVCFGQVVIYLAIAGYYQFGNSLKEGK